MTKFQKKLWIGLGIMALLTPIGIYLPEKFNAGEAWGEWGPEAIQKLLGYVPAGLKKLSELWTPLVPDYSFGGENAAMSTQVISYIISGVIGIAAGAFLIYLISKFLIKHEK